MINLEVKTKLTGEEAYKRAKSFFGEGGLGLKIVDESGACLNFEGSGGYVNIFICCEDDKTKVELVSQEWERQVEKFASGLS